MNRRQSIVVLFVLLAMCSANIVEANEDEQMHFSAEADSVKKPVAIPPNVLAALSRDEVVKDALKGRNIPADEIPASWFSASVIHLRGAHEADLVVMSIGPAHGANVTMFWVFRPTASDHELIFTGAGHDLEIKKTRSNGYREIETLAVTMQKVSTVVYRFNGKQYTRYKSR